MHKQDRLGKLEYLQYQHYKILASFNESLLFLLFKGWIHNKTREK